MSIAVQCLYSTYGLGVNIHGKLTCFMVATQPSYDLRTSQFTMASEKTLPLDIDNYRSYEKFLIYETATPVSNEKKVVSIDSNYRRMREDPKMLPENEVLNKNAIVKAPTAANDTTEDLATQGGNKTLGVVVLTNKLVLGWVQLIKTTRS